MSLAGSPSAPVALQDAPKPTRAVFSRHLEVKEEIESFYAHGGTLKVSPAAQEFVGQMKELVGKRVDWAGHECIVYAFCLPKVGVSLAVG